MDSNKYAPPRFQHDCDNCIYLGQHEEYDLYYCTQGGDWPTVIARYGDEGSEYTSGLKIEIDAVLNIAKTRAVQMLSKRLAQSRWYRLENNLPDADLAEVLVWKQGMERPATADVKVLHAAHNSREFLTMWGDEAWHRDYWWCRLPAPPVADKL